MTRLNQTITRWQGMGLMATTLLGTGVFILPQLTLASAGDFAMLTWGLLTLAMLPLALVFAQLGRQFPSAAGPAFFVQKAFGQRHGHVIGLMFLFAVPLGAPAALIMTFEFLKPLLVLTPLQALVAQLGVIVLLFGLNLRGLQLSGRAQLGLTLAIAGVVLAMLLALLITPPAAQITPVHSGNAEGMLLALGLAIWSFLGIEAITHLAPEFKDAQRDFIPAVMGGTVLVGGVYLACTGLSMLAPQAPLAMVSAYEQLLGGSGRWVIGLLGVASGIATVNVYLASVARLAWSLSHDGVLPAVLQTLNRQHIPVTALLMVQCLAAGVLVVTYVLDEPFAAMVLWTNGVFVFIYAASMLAAWRLLRKSYRPAVVVGLLVCAVFAYSLGGGLIYGLLLALFLWVWVNIRR